MMEDVLKVFIGVVLGWVSTFIGYYMGRKTVRPDEPLFKREFNPGPTDEPEGDIWQDAMMKEEEKEERISTI